MKKIDPKLDINTLDALAISESINNYERIERLFEKLKPINHKEFFNNFNWAYGEPLPYILYLYNHSKLFDSVSLTDTIKKRVSIYHLYDNDPSIFVPLWLSCVKELKNKPENIKFVSKIISLHINKIKTNNWSPELTDLISQLCSFQPIKNLRLSKSHISKWSNEILKNNKNSNLLNTLSGDLKQADLQIVYDELSNWRSSSKPLSKKAIENFKFLTKAQKYNILRLVLSTKDENLIYFLNTFQDDLKNTIFPVSAFIIKYHKANSKYKKSLYNALPQSQKESLLTYILLSSDSHNPYYSIGYIGSRKLLEARLKSDKVKIKLPGLINLSYTDAYGDRLYQSCSKKNTAVDTIKKINALPKSQIDNSVLGFIEGLSLLHNLPTKNKAIKIPIFALKKEDLAHTELIILEKYNNIARKKNLELKIKKSVKNIKKGNDKFKPKI